MRLSTETTIYAPPERCFDLARSVDFHGATASMIHGKAVAGRMEGLAAPGDWTTWSACFFGMRFSLTTKITEFDKPWGFSDVMCAGLFSRFGHVYSFQAISPGQTRMTDEFSFQSPCGILGAIFDDVVLRRRMQTVLNYRALTLKRVAESEEWREYLKECREA